MFCGDSDVPYPLELRITKGTSLETKSINALPFYPEFPIKQRETFSEVQRSGAREVPHPPKGGPGPAVLDLDPKTSRLQTLLLLASVKIQPP